MFDGVNATMCNNPMVGVTKVRVMWLRLALLLPPQSSPAYPPCSPVSSTVRVMRSRLLLSALPAL